jgi:sugar phosphate isomerase/epimerase
MPSAINTDYNNDDNDWPAIIRQVENIAGAGFTHIQWIHDWQGDYMYSKSEMYFVRDLIRNLGLNCHTLHASEGGVRSIPNPDGTGVFQNRRRIAKNTRKDYSSPEEFIRLAGIDLIKNRIELSSLAGAGAMVLHLQLPYELFEESAENKKEYYRLVFKSLDEMESVAHNAGVKIAFENLPCTPLSYTDECFEMLFDRYGEDYIGFCFDSGHAVLCCPENPCYLLEKYQSRLLALHLQDNDGPPEPGADDWAVIKRDLHRVPFSGVVDWDRIAELVAGSPADLPADFEVLISADSEEKELALLADCRKKAERFHQMVLSRRVS